MWEGSYKFLPFYFESNLFLFFSNLHWRVWHFSSVSIWSRSFSEFKFFISEFFCLHVFELFSISIFSFYLKQYYNVFPRAFCVPIYLTILTQYHYTLYWVLRARGASNKYWKKVIVLDTFSGLCHLGKRLYSINKSFISHQNRFINLNAMKVQIY